MQLNLTFPSDNSDELNNLNLSIGLDNQGTDQIRSVGSVKLFTKENFKDAISSITSSLYFSLDNYSKFYVKNIMKKNKEMLKINDKKITTYYRFK